MNSIKTLNQRMLNAAIKRGDKALKLLASGKTQRWIAEQWNITPQRVGQIVAAAKKRRPYHD